ncbi:MAG: hypothetical protein JWL90_3270 [Chthoniobacteraceae bacterium]|nr:hypothetical protein [Chthoniobacteraceae bacterium]
MPCRHANKPAADSFKYCINQVYYPALRVSAPVGQCYIRWLGNVVCSVSRTQDPFDDLGVAGNAGEPFGAAIVFKEEIVVI